MKELLRKLWHLIDKEPEVERDRCPLCHSRSYRWLGCLAIYSDCPMKGDRNERQRGSDDVEHVI